MKTSVTWLNDYLDPPLDAERQADLLTAAGFPYDGGDTAPNGEAWQEIETTSNRGDCLCHVGLAREAALLGGATLKAPEDRPTATGPSVSDIVEVRNLDPGKCPLYTARVIRGVKVGPSPDWLRRRLETIGLVPRNNLVDATNFVLFELGQPTHVFDLDLVKGGRVEIRAAREGESMHPLGEDAESIDLVPDDLVIADAERPVALAGVKGGAETAVHEGTTNILLEAATFSPVAVRNASRRHRIASDSSYRFERGVHPADVGPAADRLASLILQIAGGELCEGVVADGHPIPSPGSVSMRPDRCRAILGIDISDAEIERLLIGLGLSPVRAGDRFECTIPPRRIDLEREADLIEEIARTHGLDNLPVAETIHIRAVPPRPSDEAMAAIQRELVGLGFHESVTHTLIGAQAAADFVAAGRRPLQVDDERASAEPVLRPSIIPSLLRVARHNHDLGTGSVRFFETASTFDQDDDGHHEARRLGLVVDPPVGLESRDETVLGQAAFGVARTAIDRIAARLGVRAVEVEPAEVAGLSPAATIRFDDVAVGSIGLVAEDARGHAGHDHPIAAAEIELAPNGVAGWLADWPRDTTARDLPAYPAIERDLTVLVEESVSWQDLENAARGAEPPLLEDVDFVTVFRGGRLPEGRRAVTLRLRFRAADRTLRHEEVDPGVAAVTSALESMGGEIRR